MLKYTETWIEEIFDNAFEKAAVKVFIKREDKNHQFVSGNKWWKLIYNLEEAKLLGYEKLLTFGGAYSNHIYSVAAAANELGFKSIGIIRGEEALPLNNTLAFAKHCGMQFHFVSRAEYRNKSNEDYITGLEKKFGKFYLIPEGGTNNLALKGCSEFAKDKLLSFDFDIVCLPVGTGGTMAGIVSGLEGKRKVMGFPVLKNGDFLSNEIRNHIQRFSGKEYFNWTLQSDYHFGGYAKRTKELDWFISRAKQLYDLPLEFVYSAKMVAGIFDLISKNHFKRGSKILMIHTGGLRD